MKPPNTRQRLRHQCLRTLLRRIARRRDGTVPFVSRFVSRHLPVIEYEELTNAPQAILKAAVETADVMLAVTDD